LGARAVEAGAIAEVDSPRRRSRVHEDICNRGALIGSCPGSKLHHRSSSCQMQCARHERFRPPPLLRSRANRRWISRSVCEERARRHEGTSSNICLARKASDGCCGRLVLVSTSVKPKKDGRADSRDKTIRAKQIFQSSPRNGAAEERSEGPLTGISAG